MNFIAGSEGRGLATSDTKTSDGPPEETRRPKLRPLLGLMPYIVRYRMRVAAAFVALFVAALATLAVPLAVRRMIDFGFSIEHGNHHDHDLEIAVDQAGALRYYLVTTLGER